MIFYIVSTLLFLLPLLPSGSLTRSSNFHIDRYFLPVDNVFDYMKAISFPNSADKSNSSIGLHWIYQPLDHFNPVEEWRFWQKYLFLTSSEKNGPICVFIGGNTAIDSWWLRHTFLSKKCLEMKGNLFLLEHRFYGESIPMNKLTIDHLKYLTVAQALEDVATFIVFIRHLFKLETNKLFVFGASYGGVLAAHFRRKYSHLADAAVAMSAPMMRSYQNKEYLLNIEKRLKATNRMCSLQIQRGINHATRLLDNHVCVKKDLPLCDKIKDDLGICSALKGITKLERRVYYTTIIKDFAFLTEFDGMVEVSLKDVCDVVEHPNASSWTPLNKLLAADMILSQELFNSKLRQSGDCLKIKKEDVCSYLGNGSVEHDGVISGTRQRFWQVCTELGSFRIASGDNKHSLFGGEDVIPMSFYQEFCKCSFGPGFTEKYTKQRVEQHSRSYGRFSPLLGSRIIYTVGEDDPGLQRELKMMDKLAANIKHSANAVFKVKDSAHCGEVFLHTTKKSRLKGQHVSAVQKEVVNQLAEWLDLPPLPEVTELHNMPKGNDFE